MVHSLRLVGLSLFIVFNINYVRILYKIFLEENKFRKYFHQPFYVLFKNVIDEVNYNHFWYYLYNIFIVVIVAFALIFVWFI